MFVLTQNEAVASRLVNEADAKLFSPGDLPADAKPLALSMAESGGSYMSLVAVAYDTVVRDGSVCLTGAWPVIVVPVSTRPSAVGEEAGGVTVLSIAPLTVYASDPDQAMNLVNALMHLVPATENGVGSGAAAIMKLAKAASGAAVDSMEGGNDS